MEQTSGFNNGIRGRNDGTVRNSMPQGFDTKLGFASLQAGLFGYTVPFRVDSRMI